MFVIVKNAGPNTTFSKICDRCGESLDNKEYRDCEDNAPKEYCDRCSALIEEEE